MRNKTIVLAAAAIVVLLAAGVAIGGCTGSGATPAPTPTVQAKGAAASIVSAEGMIVPAQRVTLAWKISGRVVAITVHEGDAAKVGGLLARLDDASLQAQVTQAQAAVNVSQKQLAQLRAGGTAAERQAAKDALTAAKAALAKVKAGPTADEIASLKASADSAEAAVSQAQYRYDRIGGDSNPFGGAAQESLALQQAYITLASAHASYRDAVSHPTESELRTAESAVTQAESTLAKLDPTPEALALAQAQLDQAQAALDVAKAAAQDALITAPFDGTVASVDIDAGQFVSPGTAAVSFANTTKLQVETKDLTEVDVAQVTVGQPVKIKVDAFPGRVFPGQVVRIAGVANDHRGDQVYQVTIDVLDTGGAGLRWGMTANVDVEVSAGK